MRKRPGLWLWLCLPLAACQVAPAAGARRPVNQASGPASGGVTASPLPSLGSEGALAPRVVQGGVLRQVVGQVRVVTPWAVGLSPEEWVAKQAGRIISNNGGTLISNHGGGLISDQGGGLISDQGGGIIGKTKFYELAQGEAVPLPEDRLADAVVAVWDAAGHPLVDAQGRPVTATSDASGQFRLSASLPPGETLVFRVRLAEGGELAGGELMALVPPSLAPDQVMELRLGTASTMGAAYVLSRFVKGEQGVLNRLPRQDAEALILDAEAARVALPAAVPSYRPEALSQSLEGLLPKAPPLKATIDRIASILLAGQQDLGAQAEANEVPLLTPKALAYTPQGELAVAELVAGRVRLLGKDGHLHPLAGRKAEHFAAEGQAALGAVFEGVEDLAVDPQGRVYLAEGLLNRVWRVDAQGQLSLVLGAGPDGAPLPAPGPRAAVHRPRALALASDGALWVGEARRPSGPYRLIRVAPDGQASAEATPPQSNDGPTDGVVGLAWAPDGSLWLASSGLGGRTGQLWRRAPQGAWARVAEGLDLGDNGHLLADGQGGAYLSEYRTGKVWRFASDGASRVVAEGLRFPAGLALGPDGALRVACVGQHAVYRLPPGGGAPELVVGVVSPEQVGSANSIPVAAPGGLSYEPGGALLFTEVAGATVKRLADGRIAQVGAAGARFNEPSGVVRAADGTLYVLETTNGRLWRQRPGAGAWEQVAGTDQQAQFGERAQQTLSEARFPALSRPMGRPVGLRLGPDGLPYWVDQAFGLVMRLAADGQVEVVAGRLPAQVDIGGDEGDGGPPDQARFDRPNDLAFDAQGRLYVADTLNFRVRRIDLQAKLVSPVAGLGKVASLGRLLAGQVDGGLLLGPVSVAVGPQGELAVGTLGTTRLRGLAASAGLALPAAVPLVGAQIWFRAQEGAEWFPLAGAQGKVMQGGQEEALGAPSNLAFSPTGGLAVSDGLLNQLRLVPPSAWR